MNIRVYDKNKGMLLNNLIKLNIFLKKKKMKKINNNMHNYRSMFPCLHLCYFKGFMHLSINLFYGLFRGYEMTLKDIYI